MDLILPFKIGDLAEARSFVPGFNGAWFRCKIEDTRVTESGHLEYYLDYIDYIEEANEWVGVFGKEPNPECRNGKSSMNCQIMLRPPFPQWYMGVQVPEHFSTSELIASVPDAWKVGDWVEWLYEDCYWTAKIIKVVTKDVVKVSLLEPPMGEGGIYLAKLKDLRPALDWSIIEGWTVPPSQANGKRWYGVCLIHPKSDTDESDTDEEEAPIITYSSPDGLSKLRKRRDTVVTTSTEKLRTHESLDPSQRSSRSPSKRQVPPSGTAVEPNRPSNGTGAGRYPLRVRKHGKNALVRRK